MRAWLISCTLAAAIAGGMAGAEIYEWRDTDGVNHFTNDVQHIPAEYRSGARVMVELTPANPAIVERETPRAVPTVGGPTPTPRGQAAAEARRARHRQR